MIAENIQLIQAKINEAAAKSGRSTDEVKLIAVSKRFPASVVKEAHAAGQIFFGENYIQEVQLKKDQVPPEVKFHFIGHLQSNKAKIAAATCDMIETVDRYKLGKSLDKHLQALDKTMDILAQINIGDDSNKAGAKKDEAEELVKQLGDLPNLRVCGLMTMPPFEQEAELSRIHFRNLRLLAEQLADKGLFPDVKSPDLSMGMSGDFHIAIEEGATIVRVGTAIFGQRLPRS